MHAFRRRLLQCLARKPLFHPEYIPAHGKQYAAAENYCFIPVYIASILLFLGFIIFSHALLNKRESLFAIAFFAYNPAILSMGRNLDTWIFTWLFSLYGLLFLWKYYNSKKGSKKEIIYIIMSAAIFGTALATHFTLALFFIFSIFIIIEKYKDNLNFKKGNAKIPLPLAKTTIIFIIVFTIVTMIPYQLNPKNFIDVYMTETTTFKGDAGLKPGLGTINASKSIITNMNIIDTIILIYSVYILYRLFRKNQKSTKEKFIYYNILLFILATTLFTAQLGGYRSIPFIFTIPIMMSLALSDKEYSLFQKLKINNNIRTRITYIIIILYIALSIMSLYPIKPYYLTKTNELYCSISSNPQCNAPPYPASKLVNYELSKFLKDNETFYNPKKLTGETYFYLRNEDYYNIWLLETYIQREYKVTPSIYDIIRNYNFNNRTIQYLVLRPDTNKEEEKSIIKTIKPFKTIKINNIPVAHIYNINQLPKMHAHAA